jgi:hypothetical protein
METKFFTKTPLDQQVEFLSPILPPPTRIMEGENGNPSRIVVLVLSHQESFIKRQAIRETWAANHSNVIFVVAQSACVEVEQVVLENGSDSKEESLAQHHFHGKISHDIPQDTTEGNTKIKAMTRQSCKDIHHNFLRLEQEKYKDLLEIPMEEDYRRLPEKVIQAYHWVSHYLPHVEFVAKSDDDMFVRVGGLEQYLKKYNSNVPMVIGEIIYHSPVHRSGKWAEDFKLYPHDFYPFWPKGSAGHVCSRAAVKYFSNMSELLRRSQGEDTSIGIWLDEARKSKALEDVVYIDAKNMFGSIGKDACRRHKYMMVGHDLSPDEIFECHNKFPNDFAEVVWMDNPSEFKK